MRAEDSSLGTRTPAEEEGRNPVKEGGGISLNESSRIVENNDQILGASLLQTFQAGGPSNPLHKLYSEPGGRRILIHI
jgi:hypothetical protein